MILDPIGYKLIWRTYMKKIVLILSLALMSNYAMSHCGSCGTGDKHGEGEKCQKGANECKSGLVCKLEDEEYRCKKEEKSEDNPYSY